MQLPLWVTSHFGHIFSTGCVYTYLVIEFLSYVMSVSYTIFFWFVLGHTYMCVSYSCYCAQGPPWWHLGEQLKCWGSNQGEWYVRQMLNLYIISLTPWNLTFFQDKLFSILMLLWSFYFIFIFSVTTIFVKIIYLQ